MAQPPIARGNGIMIGAIAAFVVVLTLAGADGAAAQVPSIDLQRTCRATGVAGEPAQERDFSQCMDAETKARDRLQQEWNTFSAAHKRQCVQPSVYLPSYTEWLTCLEMERLAQQLRGAAATANSTIVREAPGGPGFFELSSLGNPTRRLPPNLLPRPRPVITILPARDNATAERPDPTGALPRPRQVAPTAARTRPATGSARQP